MRRPSALAALLALSASCHVNAQFVTPTASLDGWTRNVTPFSTYGRWDTFLLPAGPNLPQQSMAIGALPLDAPDFNAFDTGAPFNGAFITSGLNIYSFSGIIEPQTSSPGFDLGYGHRTDVWYQVRSLGVPPDLATFRLNNLREPVEIVVLGTGNSGSPFGGILQDTFVRFEIARSDLQHVVNFSAINTSLSYDIGIIDTFTQPIPCAADIDLNNTIDFLDALLFLSDANADNADWDNDDDTDGPDLAGFVAELNSGCTP